MSSSVTASTPAPQLTRGRTVALVTVLILGVLAYQLNSSMLNPALPDMAERLGESVDAVSQVISLFFLAGAVGGVVLARWSDFFGRRRMFILVLSVLMVGTILCLVAPNLPLLLVGRVLQGATAAAFPLAYILLNENLSAKAFATAMGVVTAVNGGVGGLDAYLGGALADTLGYRAIFVVILVFGVVGLVAIWLVVPRDGAPRSAGKMDWWGAALFSIVLIALTYFVSEGSSKGWLDSMTLVWAAITIVAFVGFVIVALFPTVFTAIIVAVVLFGIAYNGLALTTVNGLGVLLSPKAEPGILPGLNGAAFGIGASLGIAVVAPYVAQSTREGFITELVISCGLAVLALVTSMFIRPPAGEKV